MYNEKLSELVMFTKIIIYNNLMKKLNKIKRKTGKRFLE